MFFKALVVTFSIAVASNYLQQVRCSVKQKQQGLTFIGNLIAGTNCQKTFDKVNEYLVKNVKFDNVETDLNEAIDWLESKSTEATSVNKVANPYSRSLNLLKALRSLKGDKKCDLRAYEVLQKNDLATRRMAHWPKELDGLNYRRIDRVVSGLSRQHALDCQPIYPIKFRDRLNDVLHNWRLIEYTGILCRGYILGLIKYHNDGRQFAPDPSWLHPPENDVKVVEGLKKLFDFQVRLTLNSVSIAQPQHLHAALKYLVERESPSNAYKYKLIDIIGGAKKRGEKVEKLFNYYIINPCEYYTQMLMFDIFKPAIYDMKMLFYDGLTDEDYLRTNLDFHMGRFSFVACSVILSKRTELLAGVKEIALKS